VSVPQIGQNYRGVDGHCGYLLRQAGLPQLVGIFVLDR
jgi:hypothetical protein